MRTKGFTLVEILIVVVILGILAAIVIPQFTSASTQARESALVSDLQSIRSQIELYKIHHGDQLPGTAPTGATFVQAMTQKTDQDGDMAGNDKYGPYMQAIPINPFSDSNSVTTGSSKLAAGSATGGWYFNTSGTDAGLFQAADDKANPDDATYLHVNY